MSSDKELADAVVELGVGERHKNKTDVWYEMPDYPDGEDHPIFTDNIFVRDWRVLGALIEKMQDSGKGVKIYPHAGVRDLVADCVEALK